MEGPTKRTDFCKVGDRVRVINQSMVGVVERIIPNNSIPTAVVRWPASVGRHTITTLRVVPTLSLVEWKSALIAQHGAKGVRFERDAGTTIVNAFVLRTKVGTYNTATGEHS